MVVLAVDRGRYLGLDHAAAAQWLRLAADPPSRGASHRVTTFEARLTELGIHPWLPCPDHPPAALARPVRRRPPHPATLAAWIAMARTSRRLRRGFGPAYRAARSAADRSPARPAAIDAGRALAPFLRAERLFVWRAGAEDCLPRSLALHAYLRGRGLPAVHRIGVAAHPFRAHAWVELDGRPLLQDPAGLTPYRVIAEIA